MEYQLSVDRYDLLDGLKKFKSPRRIRSLERALLGFDGKYFSIEALDQVIVAKAEGLWPGIASVSATLIVALAKVPPAGDPIMVMCTGSRLQLGSLAMDCTWQPVSHTLLRLPATADWAEAISLKYCATRAEILAGKLEGKIRNAERKLDSLIVKAAKSLAPVGVTEQDIRSIVERRLEEKYADRL